MSDSLDQPIAEDTFASDERGAVQPFGIGARNCIGMNLAMAEMRLILALFIWHFDVRVSMGREPLVWENQKAYNNWWRVPMSVDLSVVNPTMG
jgi:cytochrome P450